MKETFKRWQVLAASTAILLCTGAVYSFSVFAGPLSSSTGWSMSEIMLAFAINSAIGPIPMILGGYLVDKGYVKWTIALGALLFASGFYLTGYASSPAMLYLTYGLMAGLGQGFAYSGALSNSLRLFPDKRGLASGILTGGMGFAAVIASPVASSLIQKQDAFFAFRTIGLVYIVVIICAIFFIKAAPSGYQPTGWKAPAQTKQGPANKKWKEMLQSPLFYIIISMFFVGAFSGLMIASQASPIGQSMFGLSAGTAALYVSLYSIANSSGRFIWGSLSDKIGRFSDFIDYLFSHRIGTLLFNNYPWTTWFHSRNPRTWYLLWWCYGSLPFHCHGELRTYKSGGQLRHRLYRIFFSCIFCT